MVNMGIDGWRLDAADLISDEYLISIYKNIKEINPDSIIIGELWNDASTFIRKEEKKIKTYIYVEMKLNQLLTIHYMV